MLWGMALPYVPLTMLSRTPFGQLAAVGRLAGSIHSLTLLLSNIMCEDMNRDGVEPVIKVACSHIPPTRGIAYGTYKPNMAVWQTSARIAG